MALRHLVAGTLLFGWVCGGAAARLAGPSRVGRGIRVRRSALSRWARRARLGSAGGPIGRGGPPRRDDSALVRHPRESRSASDSAAEHWSGLLLVSPGSRCSSIPRGTDEPIGALVILVGSFAWAAGSCGRGGCRSRATRSLRRPWGCSPAGRSWRSSPRSAESSTTHGSRARRWPRRRTWSWSDR